ncbi:MAG TPA: GNAT family N-acetyltransferase [Gemmatimonadaceae bacterium]|nr:GNAT family N-acetyltransferase [Gemmatimonadaceae bacterium]
MASARSWRHARLVEGPFPVTADDIAPLNDVFSDAFTERYRRDGMVGVRVPYLNPAIWRYAIEDAADGAMLWRGERGEVVAFNIAHRSGAEGWMGPLAVRPEYQGTGVGKRVVREGIDWLQERGCAVVGLETMPRTMDNIGFYAALGFEPGRLTLTLTFDAAPAEGGAVLLGRLPAREQPQWLDACRRLTEQQLPGYDFTRELVLTERLALGDTVLLGEEPGRLRAFALCHTAPLVEGRAREELRVLKLALPDLGDLDELMRRLADYARRSGTRRVAMRVQGEYAELFRALVARGARVRWTDLRMTLAGYAEPKARSGAVLSNWEI